MGTSNSSQPLENRKVDFVVAPWGDDSHQGTVDRPFATLSRARDAVREKISAGLAHDIHVLIRKGTYRLNETLVFGSDDSGSDEFPITYAAFPGEHPVISGARPITEWRKLAKPVPGLPDTSADHVWIADLPKSGGKPWRFSVLYDGQGRLTRAHTPPSSQR